MYNINCINQNCSAGCCNQFGTCTDQYRNYSSNFTTCVYYYGPNAAMLSGSLVAIMLGLVLLIIIIFKKCHDEKVEAGSVQKDVNRILVIKKKKRRNAAQPIVMEQQFNQHVESYNLPHTIVSQLFKKTNNDHILLLFYEFNHYQSSKLYQQQQTGPMGFNQNCIDQHCQFRCCDYAGFCPIDQRYCYFNYKQDYSAVIGAIVGAIIGCLIIISLWVCYCKYKCHQQTHEEQQQYNLMIWFKRLKSKKYTAVSFDLEPPAQSSIVQQQNNHNTNLQPTSQNIIQIQREQQ